MLQIHIHRFAPTEHPFLQSLTQQLTENGHQISSMENAQIILCMGEALQGFDQTTIHQIENQIDERFLGAELFIQARAFPFARIRVGLNTEQQLIVASPVDESTLIRIVRLLEQYNRLAPETLEQKLGAIALPIPTDAVPTQLITSSKVTDAEVKQSSIKTPAHFDKVTPPPIQVSHQTSATTTSIPQDWKERLDYWHLSPSDQLFQTPPELSHASIQHVLNSTTNRQTRQDPFGRLLLLHGFPDLFRPNSRVLLVTSDGGCIALHRRQTTAILSPMVEDLLFSPQNPLPQWARNSLGNQSAFAIEGSKVYGVKQDAIISTTRDGKTKNEGKVFSTAASLLLHWSSR